VFAVDLADARHGKILPLHEVVHGKKPLTGGKVPLNGALKIKIAALRVCG
jgi:hypothetical protein